MKKLLTTCAVLCLAISATAADAKPARRDDCKEPLSAAGEAAVRLSKAKQKAIKAWSEQVINKYGERYMNFENAKLVDQHCDPARVGGTMNWYSLKRCIVVARPCKSGM